MNKITKLCLFLFFTSFVINAQTYSTGMVTLSNTSGLEMQAKLDITATEVTLTFKGPADRWLAIGFGGNGMNSVTDAFIYESTQTFDKKIIPYDTPETDTNQDWTLISNTITGNKREIIATRALDTGENFDYIFTHSTNSIPVIWARGNGVTMALAYHSTNKGATVLSLAVLSINQQESLKFAMYPNPVKSILNVVLNSNSSEMQYKIYSILGNEVASGKLNNNFNKIDLHNFNSGVYLLKLVTKNKIATVRKFVIK